MSSVRGGFSQFERVSLCKIESGRFRDLSRHKAEKGKNNSATQPNQQQWLWSIFGTSELPDNKANLPEFGYCC